jgi:hypothetical protein
MDNIPVDVVEYQRRCVTKFLPEGWIFTQYKHTTGNYSHPAALEKCLANCETDVVVFLDIDCIPLNKQALITLEDRASKGILVGAVQRANHLQNDEHIYVGPSCLAFSRSKYYDLGSPSFHETLRGDVGEELTYRWQESGAPVFFLWPTNVQRPMWLLNNRQSFGYGTTFGNMFYHAFCIRENTTYFISKCIEILNSKKEMV